MMMMAAEQRESLNFGVSNDVDFSTIDFNDDDDDPFAIDADAFFDILNEENSDHQNDLCYPSTDNNTQESMSASHVNDHSNVPISADHGTASENSAETVEALELLTYSSPSEMVLSEANDTSFSKVNPEANACQLPNFVGDDVNWFNIWKMSSAMHANSLVGTSLDMMSTNATMRGNKKSDYNDSQSSYALSDTTIAVDSQVRAADFTGSGHYMFDNHDSMRTESMFHSDYPAQHVDSMNTFDNSSSSTTTDETTAEPYYWSMAGSSYLQQTAETKDEKNNEILMHTGFDWKSSEANENGSVGGFSFGSGAENFLSYAEAQYSGCVAMLKLSTLDV